MTTSRRTTQASLLPATVTGYLAAHQRRDLNAALGWFTDDATVIDEGNTYRGPDQIGAWLASSATEYTYTIEFVGAEKLDDERYVATHHLEGDFPGGVIDLRFQFTLRDQRISRLVIEP